MHLLARMAFRGIYFPTGSNWGWFSVVAQHWRLGWDLFR
jgi:hypothetical protein